MPWHTVAQGEWMAQIAANYGFADPSPILQHGDNADLVKKRPQQQLLLPNDQVFVPDPAVKKVDCPTGQAYRFKVQVPKTKVQIVVHDEDGEPIKSKPFKLTLDDTVYPGTSGGDGLIAVDIPLQTVGSGQLEIDGHTLPIRVGHLDPLEEVSGIKGRLHNLGYDCGSLDDQVDDALADALRRFQKTSGLDETGQIDDTTRAKLKDAHGC
jgi:hypothetical protein